MAHKCNFCENYSLFLLMFYFIIKYSIIKNEQITYAAVTSCSEKN